MEERERLRSVSVMVVNVMEKRKREWECYCYEEGEVVANERKFVTFCYEPSYSCYRHEHEPKLFCCRQFVTVFWIKKIAKAPYSYYHYTCSN